LSRQASVSHPSPERVAEILVERAGKPLRRGSGYLVAPGWVLTAAHVVTGAQAISVWLGAPARLTADGELSVVPGAVLLLPEADLALLPVEAPPVDRVLFGRLDRDAVQRLPAVAAGSPGSSYARHPAGPACA
jgi:S1-C subfamily serine protease